MDWYTIIYVVVGVVVALGLYFLGTYLRKKYTAEQLAEKKLQIETAVEIAKRAVNFIEQVAGEDWDSQKKYDEAVAYFKNLASKAGVNFTDEQIKGLIESVLHECQIFWDYVGRFDVDLLPLLLKNLLPKS